MAISSLTADQLDAFRKGDNTIFTQLFDSFEERLYTVAYSELKIKEDAEEVTADTFIALDKKRGEFESFKQINNFLYKVVRNKSINRWKENQRRNKWLPPADPDLEEIPDPDNTLFQDKLNAEIIAGLFQFQALEVLGKLAPRRQEVFRLRHLEGWEVHAIANHMNISKESVYTHLRLARKDLYKKLRKKRQGYYLFSTFWLCFKFF